MPAATQATSAAGDLVPGQVYFRECRSVATGELVNAEFFTAASSPAGTPAAAPGPVGTPAPPSPEILAQEAVDRVPLVAPEPRTSPPADGEVLVGFPIWLWIDPGAWQTFTAEASLPGLTVTVTATPRQVEWDLGDGTRLTCDGPGAPWRPGDGQTQTSDCVHTYQFVSAHQPDGLYRVAATLTWSVAWEASSGESGTLADVSRTSTFPFEVTERQAVVSYGSRSR